jgi:hypothetical protein
MKKVESLLFDEDENEEALEDPVEEITEETVKDPVEETTEETVKDPEPKKKERLDSENQTKKKEQEEVFDFEKIPERKFSMKDFVEIFFDGRMEINGAKIKTIPGSEVETGNLKFVFEDYSVKVYEI